MICSSRFRQILAGTVVADAGHVGAGRVRVVRTPYSSRGAYPARFCASAPTEVASLACLLTDLAALLRPASELRAIKRLRAEAEEIGSALLLQIAEARVAALRDAFAHNVCVEDDTCGSDLVEAVGVAQSALATASAWGEVAGARRDAGETAAAEIAGFLELRPSAIHGGEGPTEILTVDRSAGIRLADLDPLAREAIDLADRQIRHWSPLVSDARRLRGPIRGGISCEDLSETESVLDRVDAIVGIVRSSYLPTLSALLGQAEDLLGHVVRDPDLVRRWLELASPGDANARHALVAALGLLGAPAPIAVAWPDPADPEQALAYFVSIALGVDDLEERVRLAEEGDRWAAGRAVEVVEGTVGRVEMGCRLSVVG